MKIKLMILAAGLGTRLGDLGKHTPKCLLEVGGKTLLEHILIRAKAAGIHEIVINLHHQADKIKDFLNQNKNFDFKIEFSTEDPVLETGGGINKAKALLADAEMILIHNGDIYSDLDLSLLIKTHSSEKSLATLCVSDRDSSRGLVFNAANQLCGWSNKSTAENKLVIDPGQDVRYKGFSGIYALSTKIFDFMPLQEKFSIIDVFLTAAKSGEKLFGMDISETNWFDSGTPEKLELLKSHLEKLG
ncbi:MAG: nucleotidyltransferase family protein [Bdellovibrionota bacterium]